MGFIYLLGCRGDTQGLKTSKSKAISPKNKTRKHRSNRCIPEPLLSEILGTPLTTTLKVSSSPLIKQARADTLSNSFSIRFKFPERFHTITPFLIIVGVIAEHPGEKLPWAVMQGMDSARKPLTVMRRHPNLAELGPRSLGLGAEPSQLDEDGDGQLPVCWKTLSANRLCLRHLNPKCFSACRAYIPVASIKLVMPIQRLLSFIGY
jgi:hypothetical protein